MQPQTSVRKLCRIVAAERRVRDFGMELHAEDGSDAVLHRGDGAGVGLGQRHEVVRRRASTWSPWLIQTSSFVAARRRTGRRAERDRAAARGRYSRAGALSHLAAERLAGELHAVADAEHGNAEVEDRRVALAARRLRRRSPGRRRGSARGARARGCCSARDVVPDDLAIDVLLAHAAGDELGVLRAEVEHQDPLGGDAVRCASQTSAMSLWRPSVRLRAVSETKHYNAGRRG